MLLGLPGTAWIFGAVAVSIALVLAARLPWMLASGFAPTWSAFTFPVLAFTGFVLMLGQSFGALIWIGGVLLAFTTIYVPLIVFRVVHMCLTGKLAEATGASRA